MNQEIYDEIQKCLEGVIKNPRIQKLIKESVDKFRKENRGLFEDLLGDFLTFLQHEKPGRPKEKKVRRKRLKRSPQQD